jgi:hypothetical protein
VSTRKCPEGESVREHVRHGGDFLPDEDFTTPEHELHAGDPFAVLGKLSRRAGPPRSPADVAHDAVDHMIENFRDPAYRVEFFAAVIASGLCARAGLRLTPSFLMAFAAGKAAAWAYKSASEALESMARIELQVGAREAGGV